MRTDLRSCARWAAPFLAILMHAACLEGDPNPAELNASDLTGEGGAGSGGVASGGSGGLASGGAGGLAGGGTGGLGEPDGSVAPPPPEPIVLPAGASVGQAMAISDPSARVDLDNGIVPLDGTERTLELWIRTETWADGIIFDEGGGPDLGNFELAVEGGQLRISNGQNMVRAPAPTDRQWHHVAVRAAGQWVTLNVDGVQAGGDQFRMFTTLVTSPCIGGRQGLSSFIGLYDEVRLWSVGRSDEDLQSGMRRKVDPTTPGLVFALDVEGAMGFGDQVKVPDAIPGGYGGISQARAGGFHIVPGLAFP